MVGEGTRMVLGRLGRRVLVNVGSACFPGASDSRRYFRTPQIVVARKLRAQT